VTAAIWDDRSRSDFSAAISARPVLSVILSAADVSEASVREVEGPLQLQHSEVTHRRRVQPGKSPPEKQPNQTVQKSRNSLIQQYFTRKSLFLKDLEEFPPKSLVLKDHPMRGIEPIR
jgi:hypothetical protein